MNQESHCIHAWECQLRHQDAVEAYLRQREQLAESVQQRLSSIQPDLSLIRSRLLSQQNP